jgi:UDP-glucose 4-epimerase
VLIVVGRNGFLGSNLAHYLESNGDEFVSLTRGQSLEGLRDFEIDTIFWLASSVTPISAQSSPELAALDLHDFSKFVTSLKFLAPNARIVLASSGGAVYADGTPPFTESDSVESPHAYAKLKIEMENILIKSGLSHLILRIANAYGPGQLTGRGQGVLAEWITALKLGDKPRLFGSMEVVRDFVHVDDVVRALWLAGRVKNFSGIVNIGSGEPVSLKDCLTLLSQISHQDIEITTVASRPVDRARVYLSIERAASVLNWTPKISLGKGLRTWWNTWEQ